MKRHGVVVVVEDDESIRHALCRLLRIAGFQALIFSTAEELLHERSATNADCFVVDVQLSGQSGFDLHRQLVQNGATSPVILVTAHDDPRTEMRAKSMGASALLIKPFTGEQLLEALDRVLASPTHRVTIVDRRNPE